jgi:hypothetical protein
VGVFAEPSCPLGRRWLDWQIRETIRSKARHLWLPSEQEFIPTFDAPGDGRTNSLGAKEPGCLINDVFAARVPHIGHGIAIATSTRCM